MKKIYFCFVFILSAAIFSAIFPYPVLSNHTNITQSVANQENNFHEVELQPTQNAASRLLDINFAAFNLILPVGSQMEVVDLNSGLSFVCVRTGGQNHLDIEPKTQEDYIICRQIAGEKFSWQCRPALLKINDSAFAPCSLALYPHGYQKINSNGMNGHFCLHLKGSKTDGTKKIDETHQKCLALAKKLATEYLKNNF